MLTITLVSAPPREAKSLLLELLASRVPVDLPGDTMVN
jgi:hypothetical protein